MPEPVTLLNVAIEALEDLKATNIEVIDVSPLSSIMDTIVIASGSSTRQTKALANEVAVKAKKHGCVPLGIEGTELAEWVLVDLGDIIVHIMTPATRDFYDLEGLWKGYANKASNPASDNDD